TQRRELGRGRRRGEARWRRPPRKGERRLRAAGALGKHSAAADRNPHGVHRLLKARAETAVRRAAKAEGTRVVAGSIKVTRRVTGQITTHGVGGRLDEHAILTCVRQSVSRQTRFTGHRVRLGAGVAPNHGPCATVAETLTATHGNGAVEQPRHHGRSGAYADPELTCPVVSPVKGAASEANNRALLHSANRSRRRFNV